ncbi:MAG: transglutaminase-like domain-containing protein [Methylacidiphilales bacterium]|nr:transglutaminase-like domain-containing protein [Candidatus Methylacidiphilales bacterium]
MNINPPKLILLGLAVWLVPHAELEAQYMDSTAQTESQAYLDKVRSELGAEALQSMPEQHVRFLAQSMGRLDRATVPSSIFMEHLRLAESVRTRFYTDMPDEAFCSYVLSFRIREELSSHAGWRGRFKTELDPVLGDEKDPAAAAARIFDWVSGKIKLYGKLRSYPLNLKGDLDPLTTLRGGCGNEIDAAILAVAALRSAGIAARIVYAPVLADEDGGKVWAEYRTRDGWAPWAPSLALDALDASVQGIPKIKAGMHRDWLKKEFAGRFGYVLANPQRPANITCAYTSVTSIWMSPKPLDKEPFNCTLMLWCRGRLQPLMGRDIYNPEPDNSAAGVGPGKYVIVAGDIKSVGTLKQMQLNAGQTGWYVMDFEKGEAQFQIADKKPAFFEWDPETLPPTDPVKDW